MLLKALVAGALVVAPASPDVSFVQYPQVRQIWCDHSTGTAFQTTKGWVSVAHVTDDSGCKIDGAPIFVTEQNTRLDFSRLFVSLPAYFPMQFSCEGIVPGRTYYTAGYALGLKIQTNVRVFAIPLKTSDGLYILVGRSTVLPGMSGGPVFDHRGTAVGTINRYNPQLGLSISRSLRETSLCKS
jgi:hypothetical protein